MDTLAVILCLVLVLNKVSTSLQCTSGYPVAFMCQNIAVRGPRVTLDVSTAAATNHSSCTCSLVANITGFLVEFEDNPNATDCGVQLDLLFEDKGMQLKCGVPAGGHSSSGRTAHIQYTRDTNVDNVDSEYCLSFHANRSDVEFELSCVVNIQTSTLSTSPSSSPQSATATSTPSKSVPTPSNDTTQISNTTSTSQQSSTTKAIQSSTSLSHTPTVLQISYSTVTPTRSTISSTTTTTITSVFTASESTVTTISASISSTSKPTSLETSASPVNKTSTEINGTTPTVKSTQSTQNVTTSSPSQNVTGSANETTTGATGNVTTTVIDNSTLALDNRTISKTTLPISTEYTATQSVTESTTSQSTLLTTPQTATEVNTTDETNVTKTTSHTTTSRPTFQTEMYNTTIHDNTTNQSNKSTQTTEVFENYTSSVSATVSSTDIYSTSTEPLITTEAATQTTEINTNTISSTTSTEQTNITTTDTLNNVTTAISTTNIGNKTTHVPPETTIQTPTTTTGASNNVTIVASTTDINNITTNDHSSITTTETNGNVTTANTTDLGNTTNIATVTTDTTTVINGNITTANTTDFDNTTNIPSETTGVTNATTTGMYNETTDNSTVNANGTVSNGTTARPQRTTQGFWEPPVQNYDVPSKKNNIVIILVPVAGILLLVFIAVVVYIMCKRSKAASKRTRVPNTKTRTDKNGNIGGRGTLMDHNKNTNVHQKPENPRDMFTTQSNGKYPAKYQTKNEKLETDKATLLRNTQEETLLKQQFENTLTGDTLKSTGKPRAYEPTEREKDLLDHLELSSIVIENDPNDSNRYFKKTDPGDWYRIIMKGKKPRDSDEPQVKEGHNRTSKGKSSGSENETNERRHRRKHHRKRRSHGELGRNHKGRHSSSDSFDKTVSDIEKDTTGFSAESKAKVVIGKPIKEVSSQNETRMTSQPRQVVSKPVKEEANHEPVNTRLVVSKPSNVRMPSPITVNNSKDGVIQSNGNTGGKVDGETHLKRDSFTSSSSTGSEADTIPQRNAALRQNQTRNSLFGSGSKLNGHDKDTEADGKSAVKRPDIVPPLNLTNTGDKVGSLDDDFEEFMLSEC